MFKALKSQESEREVSEKLKKFKRVHFKMQQKYSRKIKKKRKISQKNIKDYKVEHNGCLKHTL